MFRTLRRAARTLLAAGVLGVSFSAAPLLAQEAPTVRSIQITTSQMRLEAMKVEMALMADTATYQLPIQVHIGPDSLELRGQVIDDAAHRQALRVARQSCYLPVRDGLTVLRPTPSVQPVHVEAMQRTVLDVLARSLGGRISGLKVKVTADGHVTLSGQVPTVEDKVTASRSLRGLPGCGSVINCLGVQAHRQAGHTITLVTRDGQHAVHGTLPLSEAAPTSETKQVAGTPPVQYGPTTPQSDEASEPLDVPRVRTTPQKKPSTPPTKTPSLTTALTPTQDIYVRLRAGTQGQPLTYVAPTAGYTTEPKPTTQDEPQPTRSPVTTHRAAKTPTPPPVTQQARQPATPAPAPAPMIQPTPTSSAVHKAPAHEVQQEQPWPPAYSDQKSAWERAANGRTRFSHSPAIRQAARPELAKAVTKPATNVAPVATPATPGILSVPRPHTPLRKLFASRPLEEKSQDTAGTLTIHQDSAPALPGARPTSNRYPVGSQKVNNTTEPPLLKPTSARVSQPEPQDSPKPATSQPATPRLSPSQIEKAVRNACGKQVRSVKVEAGPDGRYTIQIYAAPAGEQDVITGLMSAPEIATSNYRVQIHLTN